MANTVPTSNTKATAAALAFALSIAGVGFAAAAHAAPAPQSSVDGMHGDPGAAAAFWRY